MSIQNKETNTNTTSSQPNKFRAGIKSILVIWLFIFIGFIIIIWFGSAFMHKVNESNPKAAYILGKQLYTEGKKDAALQKFLIAIENDTTNYQAYFYLGKLSWENHQPDQAISYLHQFQHNRTGYVVPEEITQEVASICQNIGQYYIKQQNWQNARLAYDIAGNVGFDINGYLKNLEKQFADPSLKSIQEAIWPDGIAVTLEDFENTSVPVLQRWVRNPSATIDANTIVHNPVHRGNNSELLKISYTSSGPDFWAKNIYLVLQSPLAIRAYVYGKQKSQLQLIANVRFAKSSPEQKAGPTGGCFSNEIILPENQWVPIVIPDAYTKAIQIGKDPRFHYNISSIQLEMVAINTFGNDCEIYLDDIEAYLPKS